MLWVEKYNSSEELEWDEFVKKSRVPHFIFERNYIEYHSDRFEDHSLLIRNNKGSIEAILPANKSEDRLYSHQGLTFGGIIARYDAKSTNMLKYMETLLNYCKLNNFRSLTYKRVPDIYAVQPNQDDLYALFYNSATLVGREITVAVDLTKPLKMSNLRRRAIKKAKKNGLEVKLCSNLEYYWSTLKTVLEDKYGVAPVHNIAEITYLTNKFPGNIRCYIVEYEQEVIAGSLIYETSNVVHTQYIAANNLGREMGALDLIFSHLIEKIYPQKRYLNFGTSNRNNGFILNEGLIRQKEGFGALGFVQDTYQIDLLVSY